MAAERLRPHLTCPVTLGVVVDPVVAPDGVTYSRQSLLLWHAGGNRTLPGSRIPFHPDRLLPNRAVAAIVEEFGFEAEPVLDDTPPPPTDAPPPPPRADSPGPPAAAPAVPARPVVTRDNLGWEHVWRHVPARIELRHARVVATRGQSGVRVSVDTDTFWLIRDYLRRFSREDLMVGATRAADRTITATTTIRFVPGARIHATLEVHHRSSFMKLTDVRGTYHLEAQQVSLV